MKRKKDTEVDTDKEKILQDDRSRNWSEVSPSQTLPRITSNDLTLGERHRQILPQSLQKEPMLSAP